MHVMLDLETMSFKNHAAIISIGAVQFGKGGIERKFHVAIKPQCWFGHLEPSTIAWWMQQSDEARKAVISGDKTLEEALDLFAAWLPAQLDGMWGNGSDFDNVILENAYSAYNKKLPWTHKVNRCYRTLKNLVDLPYERSGVHHNALDDAETQAGHAIALLKKLGVW